MQFKNYAMINWACLIKKELVYVFAIISITRETGGKWEAPRISEASLAYGGAITDIC